MIHIQKFANNSWFEWKFRTFGYEFKVIPFC